jgi:hypothetical protein
MTNIENIMDSRKSTEPAGVKCVLKKVCSHLKAVTVNHRLEHDRGRLPARCAGPDLKPMTSRRQRYRIDSFDAFKKKTPSSCRNGKTCKKIRYD